MDSTQRESKKRKRTIQTHLVTDFLRDQFRLSTISSSNIEVFAERSKQRKRSDGNLPMTRLPLECLFLGSISHGEILNTTKRLWRISRQLLRTLRSFVMLCSTQWVPRCRLLIKVRELFHLPLMLLLFSHPIKGKKPLQISCLSILMDLQRQ